MEPRQQFRTEPIRLRIGVAQGFGQFHHAANVIAVVGSVVIGHLGLDKLPDHLQDKTGAVSYQLVIETERDPVTGKRERSYYTYPTKKQAEAELHHKIYALNTGGVQTAPSSMKLKDWLTEWMNVYKKDLEATSRASYLERIDYRITPYLGNIPLKNITPTAVQ